jgi:hypothetical protein
MKDDLDVVGRFVRIAAKHRLPGMRDELHAIVEAEGAGDDMFVTVRDERGKTWKWFRAIELLPGRAELKPGQAPRVVTTDTREKVQMSADTKLMNLATTMVTTKGLPWGEAMRQAGLQLKDDEVLQYRGVNDEAEEKPAERSTPSELDGQALLAEAARPVMQERGIDARAAINLLLVQKFGGPTSTETPVSGLKKLPGEKFAQIVSRVAAERSISLRDASAMCATAFPSLAQSWSDGSAL